MPGGTIAPGSAGERRSATRCSRDGEHTSSGGGSFAGGFELRDQVEAFDLIEPSDPPEECGGDIERDVPDDSERGPRDLRIEGVTLVHEDVGPRPRGAKQLRGQRGIDLDREHEPGGPRQFTCQSTRPRSDLDDEVRGSNVERPDELSRGSRAEEVPTPRRDPVARTRRTCAHGPSPHNPSAATSCDRVYGACPPVVVHGRSWTLGHRHYPRRDESRTAPRSVERSFAPILVR